MKKDFLALDNLSHLKKAQYTTRKMPTDLLCVMVMNRKS